MSQVHNRNLRNIPNFLNFIISFNDRVLTGSIMQDLMWNDQINMKKVLQDKWGSTGSF